MVTKAPHSPDNHPDHDMVGRIEREIDRIAHVVRQMYVLHSPRLRVPTDVPVGDTIRDVLVMLEPLRREHEVAIELAPVCRKLTVRVPEGSLQQILYNLAANAIQVSPPGGAITILAEPVDIEYIRISIRDQGPGISPRRTEANVRTVFLGRRGLREQGRNRTGAFGRQKHCGIL